MQQRRSRLDGRQKGAEYKDNDEWNLLFEKAMKSTSLAILKDELNNNPLEISDI